MLPRLRSFVPLAILVWALAGATVPPASTGGSTLRVEDYRIAAIGFRIGVAAAALCPETIPLTGLALQHLAEFSPGDRPGVARTRRLDRGPGVLSVVAGSPASEAQLAAGDVLLAVNGQALPLSTDPRASRDQVRLRLETALRGGPAELRIDRSGAEHILTLVARHGCPARIRLARSAQSKAVVDGEEVVVTTGLLAEVASDDELAVVIGHEIAHLVLRHAERLKRQGVPRGAWREWGRNAARVMATEEEADRLGLKLAAAAGYDPAAAIPFWRRFYARHDGPRLFRTHPDLAMRERLIRQTLAELKAGAQRPELGKGALPQR